MPTVILCGQEQYALALEQPGDEPLLGLVAAYGMPTAIAIEERCYVTQIRSKPSSPSALIPVLESSAGTVERVVWKPDDLLDLLASDYYEDEDDEDEDDEDEDDEDEDDGDGKIVV